MSDPNSPSLLFDKGLDLVLMFLGLYAAMAVQDFVDHGKDRVQYIKLLEGFQEELESNKAQRTNIESKLGSLDERNSTGDADKSFNFFGKQTKYMDQFVRCYTDILLNKSKQEKVSPARLKSCFTFLKSKFKASPSLSRSPGKGEFRSR